MSASCTLIETFDTDADCVQRATWLEAFKAQRTIIEQGIRDRLPLAERTARLLQAEAALPEEDLEDMRHLITVAKLLEEKLTEMLDVAKGKARDALTTTRLPPNFKVEPSLGDLRSDTSVNERRWLFIGGMQEILHHYRDSGRVLILEERDRLLKQLSSNIHHLHAALDQLDSHLVVALATSESDRLRIAQFRALAPEIHTRYQSVLGATPETGLQALLENSANRFRVQFLATSAQLCLRLYGNVSIFHLRELWLLKSMYPLLPPEADPATFLENLDDAQRQRFQRSINGALHRLCKQTENDASPIWSILQIYRYNPRFGRSFAKKKVVTTNDGYPSTPPPTYASGSGQTSEI